MKTRRLFTVASNSKPKPTTVRSETFAITNGLYTEKRNVLERYAARELFDLELKDPSKKYRLIRERDNKEHIVNYHGELEFTGNILKVY